KYTIDGVDPNRPNIPPTEDDNPYYFPPGDSSGYFVPNETINYGEFSYMATTPEQFNTKLIDLANDFADYVKLTLEGKDQSGVYDIYQVSLTPPDQPLRVAGKELPKVGWVAGLHGSEKNSVWATYYFMKNICEYWDTTPAMEYL